MYQIKTQQFSGPLDLLLQLLDEKKLNITEVSIAEVTEQYLVYLDKMIEADPEEMSDFLVLAARLLYLKSRALLPYLYTEEEEVDDLEKQLKIYKEFLDASKEIAKLVLNRNVSFARERLPIKREVEFNPPENLQVNDLKKVFLIILKKLDPIVKLPKQLVEKSVSLQKTIFDIRNIINKSKHYNFKTLIEKAENKTEVIMSFLAILELVKQRHVKVNQNNNFADIDLEKI